MAARDARIRENGHCAAYDSMREDGGYQRACGFPDQHPADSKGDWVEPDGHLNLGLHYDEQRSRWLCLVR
jgi:hypothetical protein